MAEYDLQQQTARKYIEEHPVQELLSHLLQLVTYHRPDDPKEFMRDELKRIQANEGTPSELFTTTDLSTMFDMVDVTRQQKITKQQLRNACRNVAAPTSHRGPTLSPATTEDVQRNGGNTSTVDEKMKKIEGDMVGAEQFTEILGSQLRTHNYWKPQ